MKACVLAAVAWLGSISVQTQPAEQLHAIRGRIIDDVSGLPVADVEIGLDNSSWQAAGDAIAPDAQGRFAFSGLPSGDYILIAVRPDFGMIYYDELPDNGWVQTIDLHPGDGDRTVVFRLIPRALVSGVVRDELGEPVLRAPVTLLAWSPKGVVFHQVQQASTDDRGEYRWTKRNRFLGRRTWRTPRKTPSQLRWTATNPYTWKSHQCNRETIRDEACRRMPAGKQVSVVRWITRSCRRYLRAGH